MQPNIAHAGVAPSPLVGGSGSEVRVGYLLQMLAVPFLHAGVLEQDTEAWISPGVFIRVWMLTINHLDIEKYLNECVGE